MPRRYRKPVEGMFVVATDDEVVVTYEGTSNGLLIHQAYLADQVIDKAVRDIDAAQEKDSQEKD